MATQTSLLRAAPGDAPVSAAVLVDIVVLSHEAGLFESIRGAVGERNPTWRARSAEEAVDMLLLGRCGVLIVDMATVSTRPTSLIEQIHGQFPDVVVVVAGRRDDEAILAGLVSSGLIYRFMHKPLSARRAGMFLSAAIRQYADRRSMRAIEPLLPMTSPFSDRTGARYWAIAAAVIGAVVVGVALLTRERTKPAPMLAPAPPATTTNAPSSESVRADPVLSRARAALDAGRYESPAGRNALDLFQAVLLAKPGHTEARIGLARTIDAVTGQAELSWQSGDRMEATRLAQRVLAAAPENAAAKSLIERMQAVPERRAPVANAVAPSVEQTEPAAVAPQPSRSPAAVAKPPAANAQPRAVPQAPPASPAVSAADATTPGKPMPARQAPLRSTKPVRDPLQPALAMSTPSKRTVRRSRTYGAPIVSGQAIAGIDTRPPAVEPEPVEPVVDEPVATNASPPDGVSTNAIAASREGPEFVESRALEQLSSIEPAYPLPAMRQGIEGRVSVEFTVTETGEVRDVLVTDSDPTGVFDESAIDAVSQWRYLPRIAHGRPVAIRTAVTLRFDVDN